MNYDIKFKVENHKKIFIVLLYIYLNKSKIIKITSYFINYKNDFQFPFIIGNKNILFTHCYNYNK